MICPACNKSLTRVLDSRDEDSFVRRRRSCQKCGYRFTTFERIESPKLKVKKRDGSAEDYSHQKLSRGIKLCFEKRPLDCRQIEEIITEIENKIIALNKKEVSSREIGDLVIDKLRKIDDVAYLRFLSVYKKFGSAKKFQKEAEKLSS